MDLQVTGGSSAVRATGVYGMRVAGAAAREMLVKAAAARWDVATGQCSTKDSRVIHTASGKSFGYGELVADAASYSSSTNPPLKPKSQYKLVGKSMARVDIPNKVNGVTTYGIDVQMPGMAYAAIKISPVFGGKLKAVSIGDVAKMRGVRKIVQLDDCVVVVADRFWRARDAVAALSPVFDNGANGNVTSTSIAAHRIAALKGVDLKVDMKTGSGADALSGWPADRGDLSGALSGARHHGTDERDRPLQGRRAGGLVRYAGRSRRARVLRQDRKSADGEGDLSPSADGRWVRSRVCRATTTSSPMQCAQQWPCQERP